MLRLSSRWNSWAGCQRRHAISPLKGGRKWMQIGGRASEENRVSIQLFFFFFPPSVSFQWEKKLRRRKQEMLTKCSRYDFRESSLSAAVCVVTVYRGLKTKTQGRKDAAIRELLWAGRVGELFEALKECSRVGPTLLWTEEYCVSCFSTPMCNGRTGKGIIHDVMEINQNKAKTQAGLCGGKR